MNKRGMTIQKASEIRKQKALAPTKLEILRVSHNLSQGDLAAKSGVPKRTIQCYEQRTRPIDGAHLSTLLDLCITLNCEIVDLLEDEELIQKFDYVF